jgi:hypothetical protein
MCPYLKFNLCLGNVLFTSAAVRNLCRFGNLGLDSIGTEVLQRVALNSIDAHDRIWLNNGKSTRHYKRSALSPPHLFRCSQMYMCDVRTEELLAATALFDDLNQTRLQLLNRGNVVGEDTHFSGLGGNVDLDDILGLVDGLLR